MIIIKVCTNIGIAFFVRHIESRIAYVAYTPVLKSLPLFLFRTSWLEGSICCIWKIVIFFYLHWLCLWFLIYLSLFEAKFKIKNDRRFFEKMFENKLIFQFFRYLTNNNSIWPKARNNAIYFSSILSLWNKYLKSLDSKIY